MNGKWKWTWDGRGVLQHLGGYFKIESGLISLIPLWCQLQLARSWDSILLLMHLTGLPVELRIQMTLALDLELNCCARQAVEQRNLLTKDKALVVIKHRSSLLSNGPSLQMGWGEHISLEEMNDLSGKIFAGIYSDTKIAKCVGCKTVICKPFWWKTISGDNIKIIYCECIFGNSGIMTAFQH